jgi:hypothetical protein
LGLPCLGRPGARDFGLVAEAWLFDRQIGYLGFLLLTSHYFAALPGSTTIVAVMRGCSEQKYS